MKVLAIDPSLVCTGVCFSHPLVTCTSIKTTPKFTTTQRVHAIVEAIMQTVAKVQPDIIAIEEALVATQHGVQMGVLFLQGALRYQLYNVYGDSIPVVDIHGSRLKKYACGGITGGSRDKDQVLLKAVASAPPDTVHNNDEADAFWLMTLTAAAYGLVDYQDELPGYKREVLSTIEWPSIGGFVPKWTKPPKPKKEAK